MNIKSLISVWMALSSLCSLSGRRNTPPPPPKPHGWGSYLRSASQNIFSCGFMSLVESLWQWWESDEPPVYTLLWFWILEGSTCWRAAGRNCSSPPSPAAHYYKPTHTSSCLSLLDVQVVGSEERSTQILHLSKSSNITRKKTVQHVKVSLSKSIK